MDPGILCFGDSLRICWTECYELIIDNAGNEKYKIGIVVSYLLL
jgi:hypothetical protein